MEFSRSVDESNFLASPMTANTPSFCSERVTWPNLSSVTIIKLLNIKAEEWVSARSELTGIVLLARTLRFPTISQNVWYVEGWEVHQEQKITDFSEDRQEPAPPFTSSGADYFGPWHSKDERREVKRYDVLNTCLVSRAVHLGYVNFM